MIQTAVTTMLAGGTPPPGSDKIDLIGKWILWIATAALVSAVVIQGIKIAFGGHGRGEHGIGLLMALGGAIICASAASAVTLLS